MGIQITVFYKVLYSQKNWPLPFLTFWEVEHDLTASYCRLSLSSVIRVQLSHLS